MKSISRRTFVATAGIAATSALLGETRSARAAEEIRFERTFIGATGTPIPNARIDVYYFDPRTGGHGSARLRTDEDGAVATALPAGASVFMGFYKSSAHTLLTPRLDGVPHIYTFEPFSSARGGVDSETCQLPVAYHLDVRAVFAHKLGGVADAIPRFGSVRGGFYFASGYSFTTTDEDGYMKLIGADFTGVEMAGGTRIWMYPPGYEPYVEQDQHDLAPYAPESTLDIDVTADTTVEIDISRRKRTVNAHRSDTRGRR